MVSATIEPVSIAKKEALSPSEGLSLEAVSFILVVNSFKLVTSVKSSLNTDPELGIM